MNKYSAIFLLPLLVSTSHAMAEGDIFNSNTGVLNIPFVSVGSSYYSNVAVRLDNYTVLGYTQVPSVGGVGGVYDTPLVSMKIKGFSRGQPDSAGNSTATFSILITNKADYRIGIGRARKLGTDITSVLVNEKGEVCHDDKLNIAGLMNLPTFLDTHPTNLTIDDFEVIDAKSSKQIVVTSTSECTFSGSSVSFYSTLVLYNELESDATKRVTQQPYNFVDQPMPIPASNTVANPSSCASGGLTTASFNFISPGMTLSQVNQIIGFSYDPNTVYTMPTATTYVWHDATRYIYVSFDTSGLVSTKNAVRL